MDGTIVAGARARPPDRRAQVLALAAYSLSNHALVICAPCWTTLGTACVSVSRGVARRLFPPPRERSSQGACAGLPRAPSSSGGGVSRRPTATAYGENR